MADPSQLFRYLARDPASGRVHQGETYGPDAYTVRAGLRTIGLDVESIDPIRSPWKLPAHWQARLSAIRRSRRLPQRADVADALASLLSAGIPLERALGDLAGSTARDPDERRMLASLRDGIRHGRTLDQVAQEHPDWFDAIDVAMLAVGHRSGDLVRVLTDLSTGHQRGADTSHRLVMALSYPILLLVAALGVTAFIGTKTLPQLLTVLRDAHVPPPTLTVILAHTGQILVTWWWLLAIVGVGGWWLIRRWVGSLPPDQVPRRWLLATPLARAQQRIRVAQVANVLSQLLRNGVPLAEALDIAGTTAASGGLRSLLDTSAANVRTGTPFSTTIADSPLLDPEFAQLVRVGEQAGELPDMCRRIADRYQRAAQRSIDRVAAVAEPAAILIMATIIGTVVMAAVLPLISLGDIL